ncbi:MAG TPA: dihydrofolate reductase family protein [Candidatus Angelobacter sp.]|nr:dihydrofolate reductase family protein [Candidatus Angelobacter sp.]
MRKLTVFNHVSLDGYFVDINGDFSWARSHDEDAEWNAFVEENAKGGGTLLFGRVTYDLMASYWPTPLASQHDPDLARRMNELPKVVFSRTLAKAAWSNTKLVKGDLAAEVRKLKEGQGSDMAILGSGSIVAQLSLAGLIDEYHIVVNPIILGQGKTLFDGLKEKLRLKLTSSRTFRNGNVLLSHELAA